MKKQVLRNLAALGILVMLIPIAVSAVSYPPQLYHMQERHDRFIKGDTLYLFQSGTEDIKKTIHTGDALAVYRVTESCEVVPVGIIKVVSFVGETYLQGEVFTGEIRPDDIAKKENVSCLVISAGTCRK